MYKFLKRLMVTSLLLIFVGSSLANNPPDGVSSQQWKKIKQQITASKYYPQVDKKGSYTAHNAAQGWQLHYAPDGMTTIKNKDYHIGMKLQSIGNLHLDTTPNIEVKGDTFYYQHGSKIKEWWVNSEDKVEQWFSIKQRPITSSHKLKVQIGLDTDTAVSQSGNQLTFTTQQGQSINYNKLKVWDSKGTILPSHMQLAGDHESFELIINDSQAKYPITIDPSFSQTDYIKPAVIDPYDSFGYSVDIDGDIMVIGTPFEDSSSTLINGDDSDNSASTSGAAYVFVHNGSDWVQQAYLKASNTEANDKFGESVSISGTTIVIGAAKEGGDSTSTVTVPNNNQLSAGAVYVFTRSGSTWSQQAYLKAHETGNDEFGSSVAIDDNTIVVGSKLEDGNANSTIISTNNSASQAGAAYVFTRSGTTWSQQAYLKASNAETDDQFGFSVDIDGNTIVVGSNQEDGDTNSTISAYNDDASNAGAAYVFFRIGNFWIQQAYLKANNAEAEDEFGYSVAIDGDSVVVGAYLEDGDDVSSMVSHNNNAIDAGAAYVFVRISNTWSQQAYLKAGNAEADDAFGISVAIAGDTVVVGAVEEDGDANSTMELPNDNLNIAFENAVGAVYVFSRQDTDWTQKDYLKASNAARTQRLGTSVAIGNEFIVVGAIWEDGDANSTMEFPNVNAPTAGAVYVYTENTYFIGGTVNGLTAAGLALQNNGSNDLNISSNGSYVFPQPLVDNSNYTVTVSNQPNNQNCTVINASGTIASSDVVNVEIDCTDSTYIIGVSVTGLTGAGLVFQNNGGDDLSINANGITPFSTQLSNGSSYSVSIFSQPNDANNTCQINGANSGNIAGGHVAVPVICGHDIIFFDGFE